MTLSLPVDQIIKEYQNRMNTVELAEKYGCSINPIIKILKKAGIKLRSRSERRTLDLPNEQITEEYKNGINLCELAEKYGCSTTPICRILKKSGIKSINLPKEQIVEEYLSGMSTVELAEKYNCSTTPITKILKKVGINVTKSINLPRKQIVEEYKNGMSTIELGEKYNCGNWIIRRRLNQVGVDTTSIIDLPIEQIIEKYRNGMSAVELAEKYNCSYATIINRLNESDIDIRTNKEVRNIISTYICIKCGDNFEGKLGSKYCNNCISKERKYCHLFNLPLKEAIREYFDNRCFMDHTLDPNGKALSVHHVGYDKRCGCNATQLCIFIPVTNSWNIKFNGSKEKNRWYWYSYLMNKIFIEYPNYFTYHIPVWGMATLEYDYSYVFEKFRRR